MVPARMRRQQPRLRDHVAVEKHQDRVRRRPRPGIARPRQPEPAPRLAHQLHVERSGDGQGGELERRLRAVVDDHDLEAGARGQSCPSSPARVSASASGASKQGTTTLIGSVGTECFRPPAAGPGASRCRRTAAGRGPAASLEARSEAAGTQRSSSGARTRPGLPAQCPPPRGPRRSAASPPPGRSAFNTQSAHSFRSSHGPIAAM